MTGTERKRAWRLRNPDASREAERRRAQARRDGYWGGTGLGVAPLPCASHESYWRHEHSWTRMMQRLWWPTLGAGAHRLTKAERAEAIDAHFAQKQAEWLAQIDGDSPLVREVLQTTFAQHGIFARHPAPPAATCPQ